MLRLFCALSPPENVIDQLAGLQRGLAGARWSPRENLHITLCFHGSVEEPRAEALDEALSLIAVAPFPLALKSAGFFGKADPHAVYAGVAESKGLEDLAKACARAARMAGINFDARKYIPHVTLARLAHAEIDDVMRYVQAHALFESRVWRVERFGLFSSHTRKSAPSLYRLEADYPL